MSKVEQLVAKYNQMVKTGKYNKQDLETVKAYIDNIYSMDFSDQATIDEMAAQLNTLEKACRKTDSTNPSKKDDKNDSEKTASTGDNITIVVMSVILVCSLGLAIVSLKRRKREENM